MSCAGWPSSSSASTGESDKRQIVERLTEWGVPFIDVGMGIELVDGKLGGILRVTTVTPGKHAMCRTGISFAEGGDDDYSSNIQIADLNALNAALAVIRWKKHSGFYRDSRRSTTARTPSTVTCFTAGTRMKAEILVSHVFVSTIPDELQEGVIYVSIEFATAAHKCCCGCGRGGRHSAHPDRLEADL